ncbi:LCP family protein [Oenococcus alcoholitolerans]|uniref:LCP family protein n=1 Tax=Oenococcus alcoholitolerans TaxID=931074 RepID=UPI003F730965
MQKNNRSQQNKTPRKKGGHLLRNIVLSFLGLIFIAAGIAFSIAYSNIKYAINKNTFVSTNIKKSRNVSEALKKGRPFSILLMGTDTGELGRNWVGRTDSMILVTVSPKQHKTVLFSIPRDSMVSIPGYEDTFPQKINAAYEYPANGKGHPETTIKTVEKWLNVPIDFYAIVNMNALEQIVNAVGGISVKSPLTFKFSSDTAHDYGNNLYSFTKDSTHYEYFQNGVNLTRSSNVMNGDAALAFARMRYQDPTGDYGRTLRQRLILEAVAKKSSRLVQQVVNRKFINSISRQAQTDLSFDDLLTLVSNYRSSVKNIESDHLQGDSYKYLGIVSYEIIPQKEKQRATDKIRSLLELKKGQTGPRFSGEVNNGVVIYDPDSQQTASSYSSNDQSTQQYAANSSSQAAYSSSYTAPQYYAYSAPAVSSSSSRQQVIPAPAPALPAVSSSQATASSTVQPTETGQDQAPAGNGQNP